MVEPGRGPDGEGRGRVRGLRLALTLLALAGPAAAQICGDCNDDQMGPDMADVLAAQQIAVFLVVPTPAQWNQCDVNIDGYINVVDSLSISQAASGMSPTLLCNPLPPWAPICSIRFPGPGSGPWRDPLPVQVDLQDYNQDPVVVTLEFTDNGGATWSLMVPAAGSAWPNPTPPVATPTILTFLWDLSLLPQGVATLCDLRVTVSDGAQPTVCTMGSVTVAPGVVASVPAVSPSVVFLVDRSDDMHFPLLGTPIPGNPTPTLLEGAVWFARDEISNLAPATWFDLVIFNWKTAAWQPALAPASPVNQADASLWLAGLTPGRSSSYPTAMLAAWRLSGGPPDRIVLFSHGLVYYGPAVVDLVTALNGGRSIVDTVQLGSDPYGAAVLQDLAARNGGAYTQHP